MKQLLKNILVPVLASRPVSYLAETFVPDGIPVFMFHRFASAENGVTGHDTAYLHKCLHYLKQHDYHFVSLEQVINALRNNRSLPKRSIAFTIDDGFLDHATIAAPIFIEHQCPVTIFLITGMLDGELWPWDDKIAYLINNAQRSTITFKLNEITSSFSLSDATQYKKIIGQIQNLIKTLDATDTDAYLSAIAAACDVELPTKAPKNYQAMTWESARQLEQQGVYFSPHTRSHRILARLNDSEAEQEIFHSWQRLKDELVSPAPVFCYPTGRAVDFGDREINIIKNAGMLGAVSTETTFISSSNGDPDYLFKLPRFGFPHSFSDFIQCSSWIERVK